MKKIDYEYGKSNLMENPEKYQFSPFQGNDFLIAYHKSRTELLTNLLKFVNEPITIENICAKIKDLHFLDNPNSQKLNTKSILSKILVQLAENHEDSTSNYYLNRFIRKFEIKKRLYVIYSNDLKNEYEKFTDLINYALLALNVLIKYEKTENLKFLNVSLKLNDLLSSESMNLKDEMSIMLFLLSIQKELNSINQIIVKKGMKKLC